MEIRTRSPGRATTGVGVRLSLLATSLRCGAVIRGLRDDFDRSSVAPAAGPCTPVRDTLSYGHDGADLRTVCHVH
jgi:hypothetical protein